MRYDELFDKKMNEAWIDLMAKYYVFLGTKNSTDNEVKHDAARDFSKAVNYFTGLELVTYEDLLNCDDKEISEEFKRVREDTLRCIHDKVKGIEA